MWSLIDRIAILIMGYVVIDMNSNENTDIVYLLLGTIIMCFSYLNQKFLKNRYAYIMYMFAIPICIWIPLLFPFVSIIMYGIVSEFYERKKLWIIIATEYVAISIIEAFADKHFFYYKIDIGLLLGVSLALNIMAFLLAYKSTKIEKLNISIKNLRDDSIEKTNYLTQKNKYLLDNQQNEIHIATLSERNRIAREIHDNVGHILSRSILQLGAIMAIHKGESVENELTPLKDTLDIAMNNIRESVHDLHKESFDIKEAAKKILEEMDGYDISFDCDFSLESDKEVKYAFLTILKEATTNIIKYSDGYRVKVVIRELEEYYQMLIEDNGSKKANVNHVDAGIGLNNMRARIEKLKGIITFSTENGFRIFISVPKKK